MKQLEGGRLVETLDEAMGVLRRMRDPATRQIGYDCETNGLDPRTCHIVGHVLTFDPSPSGNFYVPVRHGDPRGGNIDSPEKFEQAFAKIAGERRDLHWVGHNLMFDMRFLFTTGIDPTGTMEDTQVNEALLDEFSRGGYSLEKCCVKHGVQEKKGGDLYRHMASRLGGEATRHAQMGSFWRLPGNDPIAVDYALGDGVSTWQLRDVQEGKILEQGMEAPYLIEKRITRVLARMMRRGVRVDWKALGQVREFAEDKAREASKKLPQDFNVRSPLAIKAFMEKAGETGWPLTPTGKPQFNEAWLEKSEAGRLIVAVRKYTHLISTFVDPLFETHRWKDDRIRCSYYQMASDDFGTVTGRFSCTEPNLQQVPKRNKELGSIFRKVFIPEEGARWLSADMSQCEPRLLAHYSEAKVLVEGYLASPFVDSHASVTRAAGFEEMLGIPFKEAREYGKRLNQLLITGGGQKKVVSMLGSKGARVYDAYFEALPEIKTLQKAASRTMERRGYLRSFMGRRARLESRDKSYKGVNRLLQVGNADLIKQSLSDMDDVFESDGDRVRLLNTVHDSNDISVPEGMEAVADRGLGMMCQFGPGRRFDMLVPMAIEYRYGANWSEATYQGAEQMMGAEASDPRFLEGDK